MERGGSRWQWKDNGDTSTLTVLLFFFLFLAFSTFFLGFCVSKETFSTFLTTNESLYINFFQRVLCFFNFFDDQ